MTRWTPYRLQPLLLLFVLLAISRPAKSEQIVYRVLDPLAVPTLGNPDIAVRSVSPPRRIQHLSCDIVITGGSMGGVAAGLAAARAGRHVCLTEETNWLGGQMTAQGVSALDENRWIETTGATATYRELRQRIRAHYAKFLPAGAPDAKLNPGACWVSALCFEPRVGLSVLSEIIAPYQAAGNLNVMLRSTPVAVSKTGQALRSVLMYNYSTHNLLWLDGRMFIDATELGTLLALSGAEFRTGAESRKETGEPDAPASAHPNDLQSFTFPFVLADGGSQPSVRKPPNYDSARHRYSFTVFGLHNRPLQYAMFTRLPGTPGSFWAYRRLLDPEQFTPGKFPYSLSMINWESNDTCDAGYLSSDAFTAAKALQHGKQIAIGFAWWIQHEAPSDNGRGRGFPQVQLRSDVLGTSDGLSQYPYIRESRRLVALKIVREQDLAEGWQTGARAAAFNDSVGIGYYPIDIHGCGPRQQLPKSKPFQIPMGALISKQIPNLLAGAKDLGTTHITNGAYRLHPTEWATGEAAGALAAWAIQHRTSPLQVDQNETGLHAFQLSLIHAGQPLVWFDDVRLDDPHFVAIQFLSIEGIFSLDPASLHFRPGDTLTGAEVAAVLRRFSSAAAISIAVPAELEKTTNATWQQLARAYSIPKQQGPIRRGDFAQWLLDWWNAVHPEYEGSPASYRHAAAHRP